MIALRLGLFESEKTVDVVLWGEGLDKPDLGTHYSGLSVMVGAACTST